MLSNSLKRKTKNVLCCISIAGLALSLTALIGTKDNSDSDAKVRQIAAGYSHTVALKEDGTVWVWDSENYDYRHDESAKDKTHPVKVKGIDKVTKIVAGEHHTVALKEDGTVWVWGDNNYGLLGNEIKAESISKPIKVKGLEKVMDIATGDNHIVALKENGTVWAWGSNGYGQLGDGTKINSSKPMQVQGINEVTQVAAGEAHTVALKADGTVWSWGHNNIGQLGDGTTEDEVMPVQVTGIEGVVQVTAGSIHSAVLKADGTVWTFGVYQETVSGDAITAEIRNKPAQVKELEGVTSIASGSYYIMALKEDGTVWVQDILPGSIDMAWSEVVQVKELEGIMAIAAARNYKAAFKEDGTVWLWEYDPFNDTGRGSVVPSEIKDIQELTTWLNKDWTKHICLNEC